MTESRDCTQYLYEGEGEDRERNKREIKERYKEKSITENSIKQTHDYLTLSDYNIMQKKEQDKDRECSTSKRSADGLQHHAPSGFLATNHQCRQQLANLPWGNISLSFIIRAVFYLLLALYTTILCTATLRLSEPNPSQQTHWGVKPTYNDYKTWPSLLRLSETGRVHCSWWMTCRTLDGCRRITPLTLEQWNTVCCVAIHACICNTTAPAELCNYKT
jgi:hypothetical protein